jgi:hypothetical protein
MLLPLILRTVAVFGHVPRALLRPHPITAPQDVAGRGIDISGVEHVTAPPSSYLFLGDSSKP